MGSETPDGRRDRRSARRRAREAAVCVLYDSDVSSVGVEEALGAVLDGALVDELGGPLDEGGRRFAEHIVRGVHARRDELDELIRAGSEHWRIERMAAVDRNVLRVALFELLDDPSVPAAVVLDEAVELAKHFGGPESGAFVNGVVDGIRRRLASGDFVR